MYGLVKEYGASRSGQYLMALNREAAGRAAWHGSYKEMKQITGSATVMLVTEGLLGVHGAVVMLVCTDGLRQQGRHLDGCRHCTTLYADVCRITVAAGAKPEYRSGQCRHLPS